MNNYLKNIAAKNLHVMEVIQPRLAARFEPVLHHALPISWSLQNSLQGDDGPSCAADGHPQDPGELNQYPLNLQPGVVARQDVARKMVRSIPNIAAREQGLSGQDPSAEIGSSRKTGQEGRQRRQRNSMQTLSELKELSIQPELREYATPNALDSARIIPQPEETTSRRSSIFASSRMANPSETSPELREVRKAERKAGRERRPEPEEAAPFVPVEEEHPSKEPVRLKKLTARRTSNGFQPEETVLPSIPEEKRVSMKQEPDPEPVDRRAPRIIRPEAENVPLGSIGENKKKGIEDGIGRKNVEPNIGIKPSVPSASSGMIRVQPRVKSYYEPKRWKMEEVEKPEAMASVQVTIGRIEIRATTASAPRQRIRADPPVMSLEDYLKIKR